MKFSRKLILLMLLLALQSVRQPWTQRCNLSSTKWTKYSTWQNLLASSYFLTFVCQVTNIAKDRSCTTRIYGKKSFDFHEDVFFHPDAKMQFSAEYNKVFPFLKSRNKECRWCKKKLQLQATLTIVRTFCGHFTL